MPAAGRSPRCQWKKVNQNKGKTTPANDEGGRPPAAAEHRPIVEATVEIRYREPRIALKGFDRTTKPNPVNETAAQRKNGSSIVVPDRRTNGRDAIAICAGSHLTRARARGVSVEKETNVGQRSEERSKEKKGSYSTG
ncbi:hypothetical protein ZHAS_00017681 [Anopheles sinensis]|uniref:Uncharacterized protein n=1 Tax=Anopheles sinensis TaxID=74873 RepID=A0A084WGY7_ANOSI|nr:hypothetical protein ZHAS_00017681 [Anopheles sinensis]